jgi:putative acetyltransferase
MLVVARESARQVEVVRLLEEADRRSRSLYPEESLHGLGIEAIEEKNVRFFVARLDGRAIGCGGYLPCAPKAAELKRLFETEAARGQRVGKAILQTVEHAARQEGVETTLLEMGVKSDAALSLYRSFGYRERAPFGDYGPDPLCVFMEKRFYEL